VTHFEGHASRKRIRQGCGDRCDVADLRRGLSVNHVRIIGERNILVERMREVRLSDRTERLFCGCCSDQRWRNGCRIENVLDLVDFQTWAASNGPLSGIANEDFVTKATTDKGARVKA